ncbi:DUF4190 domain-containing protein [Streptomyces sp. NPDC001544]|uniref:DUF4190 domain-containing protein n=1 Tax=Streptomyces sp. NPDC001544 TaxID=3364584 RepID=UPI0036CC9063
MAAPQPQYAPVPPPPISPDGPGQLPYGYPGQPGYGYPAGHGYGWPGTQPTPSNGMGTAALSLGILAALCFWLWPLAIVLGVLAVIFGVIGRGKARRGEATNGGQSLAGIICGAAGLVLGLLMTVVFITTS